MIDFSNWRRHQLVPRTELAFGYVYVLLDRGEIVYVGQTLDIELRINTHLFGGAPQMGGEEKVFDSAFSLRVPVVDLRALEGALIRRFNPRHCWQAAVDESRDREMLALVGEEPNEQARKAFRTRVAARFRRAQAESAVREWPRRRHRPLSLSRVLYDTATSTNLGEATA